MPKAPILRRDVFYDVLNDGTFRNLDFALVNTEKGACVELRSTTVIRDDKVAAVDVVDASFNSCTQMDEDKFYSLTGSGGRSRPLDFSY